MLRYLCIALFIPLAASAHAEDNAPSQLKPALWHLVDIWWNTGEERTFESYAIDVTISDEVPSSVNLSIAPIGLGRLSRSTPHEQDADSWKLLPVLLTIEICAPCANFVPARWKHFDCGR